MGGHLLAIMELGGYGNLLPLYQSLGLRVDMVNSQRKARSFLKKQLPDIVVAEYNFQSDFRDRTSNLESLMAVLQRHPQVRVVVFYQPEHAHKLAQLESRFAVFAALPLPLDQARLTQVLRAAMSETGAPITS